MPLGSWDNDFNCYIVNAVCTNLDQTGTGAYGGFYYSNGELAQGLVNGTWYIDGSATGLDSCGNGTYNGNYYTDGVVGSYGYSSCAGTYWINGQQTSLNNYGNGSWNGQNYIEGAVNNSGWSTLENLWYHNGVGCFGVDSSGNGWASNVFTWFIAGAVTTLDAMGSGFWNGHAYVFGAQLPNGTGWNGYYWYINDVETTLNATGTGTWNGDTYIDGVLQVVGSVFWQAGDWNELSNWRDGLGNAATMLPDSNTSVTVTADAQSNSANNTPIIAGLVVDGANINVSLMVLGLAVFKNGASLSASSDTSFVELRSGSYLSAGAWVYGTVTLYDNSYLSANSTYNAGAWIFYDSSYIATNVTLESGNVTFKDNSYNMNGIVGTVTAQHGGGINGSNILGFA